jgi:hypothetical protein
VKIGPITIGVVVAVAASAPLIYFANFGQTIYALASTKLELVFVVTDADTGAPIPNATLELIDTGRDPGFEIFKLVTSADGTAKFFRENNSCENVIRPFRTTVTLIDLTWAELNVSAKGYQSVQRMWLHTAKYENKAYFTEGRLHRLDFRIPLHQEVGH